MPEMQLPWRLRATYLRFLEIADEENERVIDNRLRTNTIIPRRLQRVRSGGIRRPRASASASSSPVELPGQEDVLEKANALEESEYADKKYALDDEDTTDTLVEFYINDLLIDREDEEAVTDLRNHIHTIISDAAARDEKERISGRVDIPALVREAGKLHGDYYAAIVAVLPEGIERVATMPEMQLPWRLRATYLRFLEIADEQDMTVLDDIFLDKSEGERQLVLEIATILRDRRGTQPLTDDDLEYDIKLDGILVPLLYRIGAIARRLNYGDQESFEMFTFLASAKNRLSEKVDLWIRQPGIIERINRAMITSDDRAPTVEPPVAAREGGRSSSHQRQWQWRHFGLWATNQLRLRFRPRLPTIRAAIKSGT